jgi:cellulose synthase/poly-beta-1,6-N-acetylglucosamine synthase-like glycosyltransferase
MYDRLRPRASGSRPTDWLGSGNLVVRRSAFEAIGGFDTSLETCEDVDLCQRLVSRGGRIMAVDEMVNVHHGDPRTLSALFLGELWRGRDNLRVSLRVGLTLRSLPGLLIPVLTLIALVITVSGIVAAPWLVMPVAAVGFAALLLLAVPRAALLIRRTPSRARNLVAFSQALSFSTVYNFGRALALVARAGHGVRRAR